MGTPPVLYFLGKDLEPSNRIAIVETPDGCAQFFDVKKKKPCCNHRLYKFQLEQYLVNKETRQPLCPMCGKLQNRMGWKPIEAPIGRSPVEPPDYIKSAIEKHFAGKNLPKDVYISESDIYNSDEGVFTSKELVAGAVIGLYTGTIYYDESIAKVSDKVMQIFVWGGESIHIDSTNVWSGKMNHKWDWPYSGDVGDTLIFQDPSFAEYFSNAFVSLEGEIVVKPPYYTEVTVNRKGNVVGIDKEEEITIDYGEEYWESNKIKPFWDLRGAPNSLISMILFNTAEREMLYDKGVISTLVLSRDWEGDVTQVFDVVYK